MDITTPAGRAELPLKRRGRPPKKDLAANERYPLGLRVTAWTKAIIDGAARSYGRSQSQQAELLIEIGLREETMLRLIAERDAALARAVEAEARVARLTAAASVSEGIAVAEAYLKSGRPMSELLDEFTKARKERT